MRALPRNRRRASVLLVALLLNLIAATQIASAYWVSEGSDSDTSTLTSVNKANQPTATAGVGSVSLTWTDSTLASGAPVTGYEVRRHVGTTVTIVCTTATTSCADNAPVGQTVQYGVTARAGSWSGPESDLRSFTYDATAPVTTIDISPMPNAAGWNRSAVQVTLTATDAGTGVDHLTYTLGGGGAVTVNAATTTFAVSNVGSTSLTYFAVDTVGNVESTQSRVVRIDPDAPTSTLTRSALPNAAGWYNSDVTLTASAVDPGAGSSGVESVTLNGAATAGASATTTITAEGNYSIPYFATDTAGNVEGTKSASVRIDKSLPTLSFSPASSSSWRQSTSQLTVNVTPQDLAGPVGSNSGVVQVQVEISANGAAGPYQPLQTRNDGNTFPIGLGSGADWALRFFVVDAAGNMAGPIIAQYRLDGSGPVTTANVPAGGGAITLSAIDEQSGVASIGYRVDGGSLQNIAGSSGAANVPGGLHTLAYFATDNVGNVSATKTETVWIGNDNSNPQWSNPRPAINSSYSISSNGAGSWNRLCTGAANSNFPCITWTDSGAGQSGVDPSSLYYQLFSSAGPNAGKCWNGSAWLATSPTFPASCRVSMTFNAGTGLASGGMIPASSMGAGTYSIFFGGSDYSRRSVGVSVGFTTTS